jgi:hypothetical protein
LVHSADIVYIVLSTTYKMYFSKFYL